MSNTRTREMKRNVCIICHLPLTWGLILIGMSTLAHFLLWFGWQYGSHQHSPRRLWSNEQATESTGNLGSALHRTPDAYIRSWTAQMCPSQQNKTFAQNNSNRCLPFPLEFDPHSALFNCDLESEQSNDCNQRLRAGLSCSNKSADILFEWVNIKVPPAVYQYEDDCLARVIKERCYDGKVIPKLMHFVWFKQRELPFYSFVSVISAIRFVQPCLVLFHSDYLPFGRHWDVLVKLVPNILHVNRSIPSSIFGRKINVIEHSTDVARLEAIRKFGGIYMDADHILLKPLDDLRNYSVVMGVEVPGRTFGNGMFMGKPSARFLDLWYESYVSFNDRQWSTHSTVIPFRLQKLFPQVEIHVVTSFFKPNFKQITQLFYKNRYNWSSLHGMHLYYRLNKYFFTGKIESQNSSLGEIFRHVLYGRSILCFGNITALAYIRRNS